MAQTVEARPRKKRQPFMVVDRHDFERRLAGARLGLSARAARRLVEGQLLAAATVGPVIWAYTARQAVYLRMVRERGYTTNDVFGRFVALPLEDWRAQRHSSVISLDAASRVMVSAPANPAHEDFIAKALAEMGQPTLFPGCVLDPPRPDALWRSRRDRLRDAERDRSRPRRRRDPGRGDRVETARPPSPQLLLFAAAH